MGDPLRHQPFSRSTMPCMNEDTDRQKHTHESSIIRMNMVVAASAAKRCQAISGGGRLIRDRPRQGLGRTVIILACSMPNERRRRFLAIESLDSSHRRVCLIEVSCTRTSSAVVSHCCSRSVLAADGRRCVIRLARTLQQCSRLTRLMSLILGCFQKQFIKLHLVPKGVDCYL